MKLSNEQIEILRSGLLRTLNRVKKEGTMSRRTLPDISITFHIESADLSVGIMAEGFSALDNDPKAKSWCYITDISPATFKWFQTETGDECIPPPNHTLIEGALLGFAEAFYKE
jgi:hypothetical protein